MTDGSQWAMKDHSWAWIFHYFFYLLLHFLIITVDTTALTGYIPLYIRAFFNSIATIVY